MGSHRADRKPSRSHARPKGAPRARGIALALGAITVAAGAGVTAFSGGDQGRAADRVTANGADTASGSAADAAGASSPLPSPSVSASTPAPTRTEPATPRKSARPSATPSEQSAEAKRAAGTGNRAGTGTGTGTGGTTDAPDGSSRTTRAAGDGTSSGPEAQVLALVNEERAAAGCGPVTASERLTQAADDYSDVMADSGVMSHTGPDGSTMTTRVEAAGYAWSTLGENIARGQADAASVMDAWMQSPGHRANILNCSFNELGIGVHFGDGGPWWTQNFGASR
ncbi:CAP domain-containing protein [Streptomyces sp. ISL-10]|uniref:CAP domain-containing protein n=1 Tax=Streptomyces sp. ISL-10 TaxID=2819172 RepID=UPI001BE67450|nr:CAP domain-containing protein [Streptomyces sp. ISL-10]MBT2364256.1 CAP domain-containing protein [Streptomyces sp. ISL-10]